MSRANYKGYDGLHGKEARIIRVYLEYNLPDLSDTPMDFKVEAEIQF